MSKLEWQVLAALDITAFTQQGFLSPAWVSAPDPIVVHS